MQSSQAALLLEKSGLCSGFGAIALSSKARGSSMSRRRGGPGRGGAAAPLPRGRGGLGGPLSPLGGASPAGLGAVRAARSRSPLPQSSPPPPATVPSGLLGSPAQAARGRTGSLGCVPELCGCIASWDHTLSQISRRVHGIPALPAPPRGAAVPLGLRLPTCKMGLLHWETSISAWWRRFGQ